jgi:hypothetical protein
MYAQEAQLAEQSTEVAGVVSSSLTLGRTYTNIGMLELVDSFHLGWNGAIRASSSLVTYKSLYCQIFIYFYLISYQVDKNNFIIYTS